MCTVDLPAHWAIRGTSTEPTWPDRYLGWVEGTDAWLADKLMARFG